MINHLVEGPHKLKIYLDSKRLATGVGTYAKPKCATGVRVLNYQVAIGCKHMLLV